jgi:hypothetical protein
MTGKLSNDISSINIGRRCDGMVDIIICRQKHTKYRKNNQNIPLHIPEPLSTTRAAISSSSAMVKLVYFLIRLKCKG